MSDKWPKSTATNATAGVEGTFSIDTLKAAMRRMDALRLEDDVIAVSMLCPPDKCFKFTDEKGTVHAMSPAMLHRLTQHAKTQPVQISPLFGAPTPGTLGGVPVIYADELDEAAGRVRERIKRSVEAAVEVQAWWDSWK